MHWYQLRQYFASKHFTFVSQLQRMIQQVVSKIRLWLCHVFCNENVRTAIEGGWRMKTVERAGLEIIKNPNDSVSNAMGILGSAIKCYFHFPRKILQGTPWLPD